MENTEELLNRDANGTVVADSFDEMGICEQDVRENEADAVLENLDETAVDDVNANEREDADDETEILRKFPRVCARIAEIMSSRAEDVALELIGKGLAYDEAIANADKEGYVRGKNEKIELVKGHRMPQLDADVKPDGAADVMFPIYAKRSVWENG